MISLKRVPFRNIVGAGVMAAIVLTAAAYYVGMGKAPVAPETPLPKIAVASLPYPSDAIMNIAVLKGFLKDRGLDADMRVYLAGKQCLKAIFDGTADVGLVAETPLALAGLEGKKFYILASITTTERGSVVIGRKDRGIRTVADLKGKKIGLLLGTTAQFMLDTLLSKNGVGADEVTLINVSPSEMQEAIASGKVDAAAIWEPQGTAIRNELGDRVVSLHAEKIYMQMFTVVARQDYVQSHPEVVRRLLEGLLDAERFLVEKPEEARRFLADFQKLPLAEVDAMWKDYSYEVRLDQSLVMLLEFEARWAIRSGLSPDREVPNYYGLIRREELSALKPERVNLIW